MKTNNIRERIVKVIVWWIVPLILVIGAVIAGIIFYREVSYATLQYDHPISQIQFSKNDEFISGNTIHGEFTARDNNLGALGIKVRTFNRLNDSVIVFRLREKGKSDWYCLNTYVTDRWPNNELYPFGFPVIKDSLGRTYEFEFYVDKGESGNAIGFVKRTNFFVSRYTFDKNELFFNKLLLIEFLQKKSINLLTNINYLVFFCLFIIPLFIYILIILNWSKIRKIKTGYTPYYLTLFIVLGIYIFYPVLMIKDTVLFIAFLILATSLIFKISYSRVFTVAAFITMLCPVWLYIQQEDVASRCAVLVFFLMIDGLVLLVKDLYFPKKFFKRRNC